MRSLPGEPGMQRDLIVRSLRERLPGYLPGYLPITGSKADAIHQVFARYLSLLDAGTRGLRERYRLAFLDMLGIHLLPAQPARVPVTFQLAPDSPVDVTLAADSQVAAVPPPLPPDPLANDAVTESPPVVFFTERTVTLARAKLKALYSIDPQRDEYADHVSSQARDFTVFGGMVRMEHAIYLGHDRLFKLGGHDITLLIQCTLDVAPLRPLDLHWQYLTDGGWITLERIDEEDTTRGLTRDGQIALRLSCGPDARRETFGGRTSYWVRGTLKTPVLRGEQLRANPLTINELGVRVKFRKTGLLPEAGFMDGVALDLSKAFYPFGAQPLAYNTFYLASRELFQRGGARETIAFTITKAFASGAAPNFAWEYFGSGAWQKLSVEPAGFDFTASGAVTFLCPRDWQESDVNGVRNYWLRLRVTDPVDASEASPLVVGGIALSYAYLTDPEVLDHCLTRNEFVFEDQTEAARWPDRSFDPFRPVSDLDPTWHFGFDQRLPAGLISTFVKVPGAEEEAPNSASAFTWEYLAREGWRQLGVRDETNGLRQSGMIQFIGPPDAVSTPGQGGDLFRIRARLKAGAHPDARPLGGVWLNSAWARHSARVEQELLAKSDGTQDQAMRFVNAPVLEGESIEVEEWRGRGEGWRLLARELAETELRYERDPVADRISAVWVRWRARPFLYEAGPRGRVFVIERATGLIRFGNGEQGMVPPAGSNIVASYSSGGGSAGNLAAATVTQLRSAVPFVVGASNPVAAEGGADAETLPSVQLRGPQQLRHRGRAIAAGDIEWIARDASPEIARARCLSATGPEGFSQRGWISVIVVPHASSPQRQPAPSAELQRRIAARLRERVPATVARRIRVIEPSYLPVSVGVEAVPLDPNEATLIEARLRRRLDRFLHPLTGGPEGEGWQFGERLQLSNLAVIIENTEGIDYAHDIRLFVGDAEQSESIAVPRDALICAGAHEIKLVLRAG